MIILALLLLVLPGLLSSLIVVSASSRSRASLVLGYGFLLGLVGVPLLLRLFDLFGLSLAFANTAIGTMLLSLVLGVLLFRGGFSQIDGPGTPPREPDNSLLIKLVFVAVLAMLAARAGMLAIDTALRPLFGWDATMHWATKARVWFEYLELRPFVENADWLTTDNSRAFTDHHPGYPITTPLLQLWMTSALGVWDDSLMNLPWIICFVGLGFAFYGQVRQLGASSLFSIVLTYFLLSLPLLNTHVALAGYADFFLGSSYCLAIMAFHNWTQSRDRSQALLAIAFALACPLIKDEGVFWLLTFIPALLVVLLPGKKAWVLIGVLAAAGIVALLVFPKDLVVFNHSLNELRIFFRPAAVRPTLDSFFTYDNWHMLAYLFVGLIFAALWFCRSLFLEYRGLVVALLSALLLFCFLFFFTAYSGGAIRHTAVGRISLQLVPSLMFFCAVFANALLTLPDSDAEATSEV